MAKPFLLTIPHSGERVPDETPWLKNLPETLLMYDVDRYVDKLYDKAIKDLALRNVKTEWHRYAIDLNRLPDDVDADSVEGHKNPSGKFPRGLHWSITTKRERLMQRPMSQSLHDQLVNKYFEPFHAQVRKEMYEIKKAGAERLYHVDAHSMPSMGTSEHLDPGQIRADAVISDVDGTSCSAKFRDLVVAAYEQAGFKTRVNWPYKGGRVTQTYGKPSQGQESIQVELNRSLYMDEASKALLHDRLGAMQDRLKQALTSILKELPDLP